jgi:gamma-glutamylcyclotransferase (GGCT)/AIG2-like uncharacterized protein YtfP
VFVYGTLKRGLVNFPAMRGVGIEHIEKAVLRGVTLYNFPKSGRPYPYPALMRGRGAVLGELHTLSNHLEPLDALRVLDHVELEGFEYRRVPCWVIVRGHRLRAWVYLYSSVGKLHRLNAQRSSHVSWQPSRRGALNPRDAGH